MISARTKAVLAATKARGVRLGRPENLRGQDAGRERARRTALAGGRSFANHRGYTGVGREILTGDRGRPEQSQHPNRAAERGRQCS